MCLFICEFKYVSQTDNKPFPFKGRGKDLISNLKSIVSYILIKFIIFYCTVNASNKK